MPKTNKKSWYSIEAKDNSTEASVHIYDEIGLFGITAKDIIQELNGLDVELIHNHLNTPGGNVFDGIAIHNAFKNHSAKVITHIDGVAASIGSLIAMAGDEVRIASNAFMMIHDSTTAIVGGADSLRERAALMDKMNETVAITYADKSGSMVEDIRALMAAETWFMGEEAVEAGLADTVTGAVEIAAHFDMCQFKHAPQAITESFTGGHPSIRDLETALRDAGGLSQSEAKGVLAKGYSALEHRDDATPPHRDDENKKTKEPQEEALVNIDELKAQHPALYAEVFAKGVDSVDVAAAVATYKEGEIARVADVRAQAMPGFEAVIDEMVADGKSTGGDAAKAITALQRKQMEEAKAKIEKDAGGVKVPEAPTGALGAGGEDEGKDFMSLVQACMKEENISKAQAITMTVKAHPKAHKAYLAEANEEEDE